MGSIRKIQKIGTVGAKNIFLFSKALDTKSLWRCVEKFGLWGILVISKCLRNMSVFKWFGLENKFSKTPQTYGKISLGQAKLLQIVLVGRLEMVGKSLLAVEFGSTVTFFRPL